MKRSFKFKIILALVLLAMGAALTAYSFYSSKYGLEVTHCTVSSEKVQQPLRIVQLSDLHNSQFGQDNSSLIQLVQQQRPDLILLTGDMLNQNDANTGIMINLVGQLSALAPTYFSYGNHEVGYETNSNADLVPQLESAGAVVLERSWTDLDIKGQSLRIGGIYGYCLPAKYYATGEARKDECDFLYRFQRTSRCTLLLCHMPVCWIINDALDEWNIDYVFAGHAHGGQIRIPLIGGLHAPDQGWFPGRESGLYFSADGQRTLVLSRGLGTSGSIPRFNNIPEVLVIDLIPK